FGRRRTRARPGDARPVHRDREAARDRGQDVEPSGACGRHVAGAQQRRDGGVPVTTTIVNQCHPSFVVLSRRAFAITDTELKLIAAAAIIGLSNTPKTGYSTPAAIGTPSVL